MGKGYEVSIAPDQSHVYLRVTRRSISLKFADAFTRALTSMGDSAGLNRCLIDVRGSCSSAGVAGEYQYAYADAENSGLSREWRIALLKDSSDETHDFLLTVMRNAGWMFRYFEDDAMDKAVAWLKQSP